MPTKLKFILDWIIIIITINDNKLPEKESKVVGLNNVPEIKPPMKVLLKPTINANLKFLISSSIRITTFARPSFIKGKGLGTKFSTI